MDNNPLNFKLSKREQLKHRPTLKLSAFTTGLGGSLSMNELISLMAIAYGASTMQIGILGAASFMTGAVAILVPLYCGGIDTAQIWARFWFLRAIVMLGYFSIPFLPTHLQVWAIIFTYYLFNTFRAMGFVGYLPTVRSLARPKDVMQLIASLLGIFNLAHFCGYIIMASILFLLPGYDLKTKFSILITFGLFFNLSAAFFTHRLPQSGILSSIPLKGFVQESRQFLKHPRRLFVIILTSLTTSLLIVRSYNIAYLKKTLQLDEGLIMLFILGGLLACYFTSLILKSLSNRISTKTLILATQIYLAFIGLAWLGHYYFSNHDWLSSFSLTLLSMIGTISAFTLMMQMQNQAIPDGKAISINTLYQLVAFATSVLTLIAIKIIDQWEWTGSPFMHQYSNVFMLSIFLSLSICALMSLYKSKEEKPWQDLQLLTPVNLLAMYRVWKAESADAQAHKRQHILEGAMTGSGIPSKELLKSSLNSNDLLQRYAAIRSVINQPSEEWLPQVLKEASSKDSPIRHEALTALGFLNQCSVIPVLLEAKQDNSPFIRACAIKSLLRLNHPILEEELLDEYQYFESTQEKLHILVGLVSTNNINLYLKILEIELNQNPESHWLRPIFHYGAQLVDARETMVEIFDEEDREAGKGLTVLEDYFMDYELQSEFLSIQELIQKQNWEELEQKLNNKVDSNIFKISQIDAAYGCCVLVYGLIQNEKINHLKGSIPS